VLVIEKGRRVGGVSVHTGTIPSKTLRETVLNLTGWRERGFYGSAYRVKQDISATDLMARMHKTLDHEVDVLEHQFARNGVERMHGMARFLDPHRIEVRLENGDTRVAEAEKIMIAVGTRPYHPAEVPFNGRNILDSDDILEIPNLPRSLTVVGGGVIGVEYATIFAALDVPVTLIDPRPRLLDFMDDEIVAHMVHLMRDNGMALRLGGMVDRIRFAANGNPVCMLEDGRQVSSEVVLLTSGRCGATAHLNLASIGLEVDRRGYLAVDRATFQTSVPGVYAAGDVVGFPCLASVSMEQGRAAACHAFGAPCGAGTVLGGHDRAAGARCRHSL